MISLVLAAVLSLFIGVVLGMLGGGGGILAVPVLVYVVGVAPRPAIAASLFLVGVTSLVGAALHARAGRVRWRTGVTFGAASMAGAFAGGKLARFVPEHVLLGALATVMLVTAIAMLRGRSDGAAPQPASPPRLLLIGAGVGVVSGLVGAGGGFLIVPALTLFGGLAMHEAIATSLFIIAVQSFAGFAGHVGQVDLDARLVGVMTAAAIFGMAAGSGLGRRVPAATLKRAFAGLVLVTGLLVIGRQIPLPWAALVAVLSLVAALAVALRAAPAQPPHPHRDHA